MTAGKFDKQIIQETINLIQIPSVKSEPAPDAPFGVEIKKALLYALELSQKLGLKTTNLDNYLGYAEFGQGDKEIAILVHLDVVPVSMDGWHYPPFQGVIEDNKLYGRGTSDDKGPAMAVLFALKRLIEEVPIWNKRIRIIFCTDEESSWQDIAYYKKIEKAPTLALTPDAFFPVIYAEKGILHLQIKTRNPYAWLNDFSGGQRPNMVPEEARLQLTKSALPFFKNTELSPAQNLVFKGKAAHASYPEKGDNAILKALHTLCVLENTQNPDNYFFLTLRQAFQDIQGGGLNICLQDSESGKLTLNLGKVETRNKELLFTLDIRYPVTFDKKLILERVLETFPETKEIYHHPPLFRSLEKPDMQYLLNAYREVTSRNDEPLAIGGGTLARAFANAVAFGAGFPDEEETAHQSNEYITIESLLITHEVYYCALKKLLEKDDW